MLEAVSVRAFEVKASGRVTFGASVRTEAADPELLLPLNATALGLTGKASGGQNADDANNNFARGDVTSRVVKGYLDLAASHGSASALVRIKGWRDDALIGHGRPWGNSANGYVAGAPLSDAGAPRRSRFSGVALGEAYVQNTFDLGHARLFTRLGHQLLNWGERASLGGGIGMLNPADFPALRRAGTVPQEQRVAQPMLFARLERPAGFGVEAYYQSAFRPAALDMCGTFSAGVDYQTDGCDYAYAGGPPANERERVKSGYFVERMDSPTPTDEAQYGLALTWKSATPGTEIGLYHARYIMRLPMPGMRKAARPGPALIPFDPDGRNLRFFTEYVGHVEIYSLIASHKRGADTWSAELAVRPGQPLQLPPSDVIAPFLNPSSPALLRADVDALAPGGIYHAYDRYRTSQLQVGWQHDWGRVGPAAVTGSAELVYKHARGLPDPLVRRYGRADAYGVGPIGGVCNAPPATAWRQCSTDGYVTPTAASYRLRVDARLSDVLPGLALNAQAIFTHDFKGWSHDVQIHEGRRSASLALRFEYRNRYVAEVVYAPLWGGTYNNLRDKDLLSMAVGVKF